MKRKFNERHYLSFNEVRFHKRRIKASATTWPSIACPYDSCTTIFFKEIKFWNWNADASFTRVKFIWIKNQINNQTKKLPQCEFGAEWFRLKPQQLIIAHEIISFFYIGLSSAQKISALILVIFYMLSFFDYFFLKCNRCQKMERERNVYIWNWI